MDKKTIAKLIDLVLSLLQPKKAANINKTIVAEPIVIKTTQPTVIDWTDPKAKISEYFTVKEALWLPSWQTMHSPTEEEKLTILNHSKNMDKVREILGVPIQVHCWIRPILNNPNSPHHGEDYNSLVKGAKNSRHRFGDATDFDAVGLNCDKVRELLESKLDELNMRMEKMPGSNWVHVDSGPVISTRYFNP
jgi:hypothetical protein